MAAEDSRAMVSRLVASHGRQLRRYLLNRVRAAADVPDIIQEVYLRMLRIPNTESIRSPEAYLFTVAQHVTQQHALRQSAIPPSVELTQMFNGPQALPDTDPMLAAGAQESLEELQRALDALSPKARAAFLLHRCDGLSVDEIAVRLGISRPMVKKYLLKALMQIRLHLDSTP